MRPETGSKAKRQMMWPMRPGGLKYVSSAEHPDARRIYDAVSLDRAAFMEHQCRRLRGYDPLLPGRATPCMSTTPVATASSSPLTRHRPPPTGRPRLGGRSGHKVQGERVPRRLSNTWHSASGEEALHRHREGRHRCRPEPGVARGATAAAPMPLALCTLEGAHDLRRTSASGLV
jgi:hypothetical protein